MFLPVIKFFSSKIFSVDLLIFSLENVTFIECKYCKVKRVEILKSTLDILNRDRLLQKIFENDILAACIILKIPDVLFLI